MESMIDGEDSLIGLKELRTIRKNLEKNSENSLESHITSPKRKTFTHLETYDKADEISKESKNEENSRELHLKNKSSEDHWENIQEIVESDFLTSPADIYTNRKVELEDAVICDRTKEPFDQLCNEYGDVFSKNNQDIGKTTLIEMEINTGDSLPVAQSPYTLPLKHYEWVRKEIETLEKAGVIVKSLKISLGITSNCGTDKIPTR